MERLAERKNLRQIFSRAANSYETQARFQKKVSLKLFNNIVSDILSPNSILEIGSGTGFLTKELVKRYQTSEIYGIDFAFGMDELARKKNLPVLQADAKSLPFKHETFDLIVSNLVFHWVNDLENAFKEVYRALKKEGSFYFNFCASQTLKELRFCFLQDERFNPSQPPKASLASGGKSPGFGSTALTIPSNHPERSRRISPRDECKLFSAREGASDGSTNLFSNQVYSLNKEKIEALLRKSNFKEIKMNTLIFKENFEDLFSLVKWLKSVGTNRLTKPAFLGKDIWQKANKIYLENFKDNGLIYATFEVVEVKAQK